MDNKEEDLEELIKDQPPYVTELILKLQQERLNIEKKQQMLNSQVKGKNNKPSEMQKIDEFPKKDNNLSKNSERQQENLIEKPINIDITSSLEELDADIFKIDIDKKCDAWKKLEEIYANRSSQWSIVTFFVKLCLCNNSMSTNFFALSDLVKWSNYKKNTILSSLKRLEKKGVIVKEKGLRGIGGKSRYKITSEQIKRFVLEKNRKR